MLRLGEACVQMNFKIFYILCLRDRFIFYVDYGTRFSAIGESDMG
jgi:hypothetical protein